jgi:hypothetical protein
MGNLADLIREKKSEFQELSKRVAVLRQELEEARGLLDQERQSKRATSRRGPGAGSLARPRPIKPDSAAGLALAVLRDVGRPIHATELVRQIQKSAGLTVNQATLVGQLTRYVNRQILFSRPEPNTFGLREWALRIPKEPVES